MKKQTNELSVAEPSVAQMLSGMVTAMQKGEFTSESVKVLESMVGLYERMEAKKAEKEFAEALVALQGETIRIKATKAVDQKPDGTCRYRFAPYEEIMAEAQPMLTRHHFSVTFDTREGDNRLTSMMTLTHKSGHSRTNQFAVRYTKPPGSSDAQGDMSTKNYAKRGVFCDALNIVIDHSDDARMVGKPICKAEAEELEFRVKKLGFESEVFLKWCGAANYESISEDRYSSAIAWLERKEQEAQAITGGGVKQVVAEAVARGAIPEPKNEQGEYIL